MEVRIYNKVTGQLERTVQVAAHNLMPNQALVLLVKSALKWNHKKCAVSCNEKGVIELHPQGEEVAAVFGGN